jgi:hypothetical protein
MIFIQNTLISEDIIEEHFVCNLNACKGACCIEGDFGAPISKPEIKELTNNLSSIIPYLNEESQSQIKEKGVAQYIDNTDGWGVTLMNHGPCAFLTFNEIGIGKCGIEKAWEEGKSTFQKPISCHLYPIRIVKNEEQGFEAWNYERWHICNAACANGEKLQVRLYQFLGNAIKRCKGEDFYEELDAAAQFSSDKS